MSTALVLRLALAFAPMPTPAPAAPPAPPPPAIEPRLLATIPDILRDDRIEMPDDRNAFVVWLDAASRFQDLPLDLESVAHGLATSRDATATLDRADRVALSAWLGANGQALRTFVDGIAMDRAQVPRAASINE
ncbi:MAG: hypothetical protein KDA25_04135, partial [Phycisphaerales bacterium]|nr:hypothetical protein [Phycisphaerales bacterium]